MLFQPDRSLQRCRESDEQRWVAKRPSIAILRTHCDLTTGCCDLILHSCANERASRRYRNRDTLLVRDLRVHVAPTHCVDSLGQDEKDEGGGRGR